MMPVMGMWWQGAGVLELPIWASSFLIWSNGFMVATILALIVRQKSLDAIKLGIEAQVTGARSALEAQLRAEAAARAAALEQLGSRVQTCERELFGKDGLSEELKRVGVGVDALVRLFLRHGEKMGIEPDDIRALEEHR